MDFGGDDAADFAALEADLQAANREYQESLRTAGEQILLAAIAQAEFIRSSVCRDAASGGEKSDAHDFGSSTDSADLCTADVGRLLTSAMTANKAAMRRVYICFAPIKASTNTVQDPRSLYQTIKQPHRTPMP